MPVFFAKNIPLHRIAHNEDHDNETLHRIFNTDILHFAGSCPATSALRSGRMGLRPDPRSRRPRNAHVHRDERIGQPRRDKRIEGRCKEDPMLFRKMELYSELYSLDKNTKPGQRRILKKYVNF